MKPVIALLLLCACPLARGEACDVTTRPASGQVPVVQPHQCYEYQGMPEGSIDWSCSNQDQGASPSSKRKVARCPQGAVASCSATLTQESLASERSASREPGQDSPNIPDGARVITWYYEVQPQGQTQRDCEHNGGTFTFALQPGP